MSGGIDQYRQALAPQTREAVDALRAAAAAAHPRLTERIKWNAPSFALDGEDRITLGVMPKGGVRAVLHRGAKVKDANGFKFEDPDAVASWPAPDRGVLTFRDADEVNSKREAISALFGRWLAVAE